MLMGGVWSCGLIGDGRPCSVGAGFKVDTRGTLLGEKYSSQRVATKLHEQHCDGHSKNCRRGGMHKIGR